MKKGIALFIVVALIIVPPIIWPGVFAKLVEGGKGLIPLVLTLLELFGLIIALALVLFLFYQLIKYFFPSRFIFEGFSNEADLLSIDQKPLCLSKLAWEELADQSQILTNRLRQYTDNSINNSSLDSGAKSLPDPQFFMPPRDIIDLSNLIVGPGADILDWVKSAEGKIPTQFGLLMSIISFLGVFIPPPVVKINAHLQRMGSTPGKVGITFEAVDIKKKHNLIRTFWQDEKIDKSELLQRYEELLGPGMRWLVLECCKQRMISHIPLINRINIRKGSEKKRQARILYLLGIQFYTSAEEFEAQKKAFFQFAVEHFRMASNAKLDWYLPDLYLANIYSFRMRGIQGPERSKMLQEALKLYETALTRAEEANEGIDTQRVIISKALAELASGVETKDLKIIGKATQEIEDMIAKKDPADFDPDQADCAGLLYNLATWYEIAYDSAIGLSESREQARRYLAYSLARSRSLWDWVENDKSFMSMRAEGDLEILKEELDKELSDKPDLATTTGTAFKDWIEPILTKVDNRLGRGDLLKAMTI